MAEETCMVCDKVLGDEPVFWDVSGGYWCESCGFKEMIDTLRQQLNVTELSEAKSRMALEEANGRVEQLEEILHAIHDFAEGYAEFNPTFEKVRKMAKEGLDASELHEQL